MSGTSDKKIRAAFETWYSLNGKLFGLVERADGQYILEHTQTAWLAWRACARSVKIQNDKEATK